MTDSPESIAFWGTLVPPGSEQAASFCRLYISIFDHLRATSSIPIPQMNPGGAKPYLNAEMMGNFVDLMGVTDLQVSPAEAEILTIETLDKTYFTYFTFFCGFGQEPDTMPREGTNSKIPLVTREGLRNWLLVRIITDPDDSYRRINALLSKPNHLFIDPFTEERFAYPHIPRCAFPPGPVEPQAGIFSQLPAKWREVRGQIMAEAQKQASQRAAESSATSSAQLNLANAELNAQRMRSEAMRNAYEERRVYDSSSGKFAYSYTPGNF